MRVIAKNVIYLLFDLGYLEFPTMQCLYIPLSVHTSMSDRNPYGRGRNHESVSILFKIISINCLFLDFAAI